MRPSSASTRAGGTGGRHDRRQPVEEPGCLRHRTERTTHHRVVVLPPLTEAQYLTLHALCGTGHPGRFKPWVNDHDGHGGFAFEPSPAQFGPVCRYARDEGLRFRTETTITVHFAPAARDEAVEPPPERFSLETEGLRAWLAEQAGGRLLRQTPLGR